MTQASPAVFKIPTKFHNSRRTGSPSPRPRASVQALEAANAAGQLRVEDPQTLALLLFGAMTRAGLLIASSPDPKATRDTVGATFRQMMSGFLAEPG